MAELAEFQARLEETLKQYVTTGKVVGAGGLAVLCAAAALVLVPGSPLAAVLTDIGGNVVAGLLLQLYQEIWSQPGKDEQERFRLLALTIASRIEEDSELRTAVGVFLGDTQAFKIAEEMVKGNPAVHGWLLFAIHQDLTEYRSEFGELRQTMTEIKTLLEQLSGRWPSSSTPLTAEKLKEAHRLLATMPEDRVPKVGDLPPGSWIKNLSPNPLFVGREADLMAIAAALKADSENTRTIVISTGIGGVGKTQLAIEFAHRYGQYFAGGVFWISLANPATARADILVCGGIEGMSLYTDSSDLSLEEQIRRIRRVKAEWQKPLPSLIIFDNCESEELLRDWLPATGGCRVLITSRRQEWDIALGVQTLHLDVLADNEGVALLRKFWPDLAEDDLNLKAIAKELGHLPLALHLAGSYLKRYRFAETPANYLAQLRDKDLLNHPSLQGALKQPLPTGHNLDVYRTFALSYNRLDPTEPTDIIAASLLARAAYFAPGESIPRVLLITTLGEAEDEEEVRQVEDGLVRCVELGLLERQADGAIRLHRLLSAFMRQLSIDPEAQAAVEETVLGEAWHINETGCPAPLLAWQVHLQAVTEAAWKREDEQAAALCTNFGYHLQMIGDYAAAQPLYQRALTIREKVLGPDHPFTASSLNGLASLLQDQGSYAAAIPLCQRALTIREKVLGPEHLDTAESLNNLASLVKDQGDYAAALPLYERALAITEKVRGPEHPDTAASLNNLASLLQAQGNYTAALLLDQRALAITEKVLGPDHPDTALSLNNLAVLVRDQGDYAAALPLYQRALAIHEKVLGLDHHRTALSLNNLADVFQKQGDYAAALRLYQRALTIREKVLGPEHPDTVHCLNNVAALLRDEGDYAAAISLLEGALAIREKVLGSEHPNTALSLNNLAALYGDQGDYAVAISLLKRALVIVEKVLGPEHPDTALSLNNLAWLLHSQGDHAAAQPLYQRALAIREKALGPDHPDTASSLNNLAGLLQDQGDYAAALSLFEQALAIREKVLGPEHSATAESLNNLAWLLYTQGDHAAALSLFEQALAIREKVLGPDHPDTASSLNNLAWLLQDQGDYTAALPLFVRALTIVEKALGPEHPKSQFIRGNLADLKDALN